MSKEDRLKESLIEALDHVLPFTWKRLFKSKVNKAMSLFVVAIEEYIDERISEHEETKNHCPTEYY